MEARYCECPAGEISVAIVPESVTETEPLPVVDMMISNSIQFDRARMCMLVEFMTYVCHVYLFDVFFNLLNMIWLVFTLTSFVDYSDVQRVLTYEYVSSVITSMLCGFITYHIIRVGGAHPIVFVILYLPFVFKGLSVYSLLKIKPPIYVDYEHV
jgi:hypothetical protein